MWNLTMGPFSWALPIFDFSTSIVIILEIYETERNTFFSCDLVFCAEKWVIITTNTNNKTKHLSARVEQLYTSMHKINPNVRLPEIGIGNDTHFARLAREYIYLTKITLYFIQIVRHIESNTLHRLARGCASSQHADTQIGLFEI